MKTTGASHSQTAIHFGISETGMIANWNAILVKNGVNAFFRLKGRPQQSMTKLKTSKYPKILTCEQQLEEEIKLLRIENEYLKSVMLIGLRHGPKNQIPKRIIQELTDDFKSTNHYGLNKMKK